MEQDFYTGRLSEKYGLDVMVPGTADRAEIHRIIFEELCQNVITGDSRAVYRRVMADLVSSGAQAIILGCTEIGLLVGADDVSVPVFDTAALHVEAAVRFMLESCARMLWAWLLHLPLTDPAFVQNPYPALERLREETPLFFDTALNKTVVLRYDDISGMLRDKRFGRTLTHLYSRDELGWPPPDPAQQHFDAFNGNHMLDSEGEKHTRLRSLVGKAFTPRRVDTLQPRIEAILEARLSALGRGLRSGGRLRRAAAGHGDCRAAGRAGGRARQPAPLERGHRQAVRAAVHPRAAIGSRAGRRGLQRPDS